MKIKSHLYPVIIITALVLFTILGFVLGFLPGHSSSEGQVLFPLHVEFTSVQFGNI